MNSLLKRNLLGLVGLGISGQLLFFSYELRTIALFVFSISLGLLLDSYLGILTRMFVRFSMRTFLITCVFLAIASSHLIGVLLPETGFDATWYHLPITSRYVTDHGAYRIPELYQSTMPRLGSMMFVIPFAVGGDGAVKALCWFVSLSLPMYIYVIARRWLKREYALLCSVIFFSFHAVAWQASSAYVDQLRTAFELGAIVSLFLFGKVWKIVAGVLLGFSLATKLASLLFFPAFMLLVWSLIGRRFAVGIAFTAVLVSLPWFLQSYFWTGNPFFPLFTGLDGTQQFAEIGINGWNSWVVTSLSKLLVLPGYLSFHRESYLSIIFLVLAPIALFGVWKSGRELRRVVLCSIAGLATWLLIPPVSTRYALIWIGLFLIVLFACAQPVLESMPKIKRTVVLLAVLGVCFNMTIRVGSHLDAVPYLIGKESTIHYIERHAVGIARDPILRWHGGYWDNK